MCLDKNRPLSSINNLSALKDLMANVPALASQEDLMCDPLKVVNTCGKLPAFFFAKLAGGFYEKVISHFWVEICQLFLCRVVSL